MKKWIALVILFITASAKAALVNSNSIVQDGIEYYIQTDKAVYNLGENIEMLHRLTNVGNQTLNVAEPTVTYTISFKLTRPQGDTLFAPAYITQPQPPGFPNIIKLNQGEYIEKLYYIMLCEWGADGQVVEDPFATVGQYSISSKYDNSFADEGPLSLVPGALHFAIIPEPCSLILFGAGLMGIILDRKKRTLCLRVFGDYGGQK